MVKSGELRLQKFEAKLQPDVIGSRFAAEKDLIISQQMDRQNRQAEMMEAVARRMDEYGIPSILRFGYQSLVSRLFKVTKSVGNKSLIQEAVKVWAEYREMGLNPDLMREIFALFAIDTESTQFKEELLRLQSLFAMDAGQAETESISITLEETYAVRVS